MLLEKDLSSFRDGYRAWLGRGGCQSFHQPLEILVELIRADGSHQPDRRRFGLRTDFDHPIVQLTRAKLHTDFFAAAVASFGRIALRIGVPLIERRGGEQRVDQLLFGKPLRLRPNDFRLLLAHHVDRQFHKIADHAFHVATVIAHLRILRGLHFDKRGVDQVGQATRDFRFADAGGAHEDHVARPDFVAQVIGKLQAPPTIAYGDGRGPFGRLLTDNVLVQGLDDLLWCQFVHGLDRSRGLLGPRKMNHFSVSTTMSLLV